MTQPSPLILADLGLQNATHKNMAQADGNNVVATRLCVGDEFYFLHVIPPENRNSNVALMDGLGGVDSALLVDTTAQSAEDQVLLARYYPFAFLS